MVQLAGDLVVHLLPTDLPCCFTYSGAYQNLTSPELWALGVCGDVELWTALASGIAISLRILVTMWTPVIGPN